MIAPMLLSRAVREIVDGFAENSLPIKSLSSAGFEVHNRHPLQGGDIPPDHEIIGDAFFDHMPQWCSALMSLGTAA
jgi:hypothetical protein